MSRPSGQTPCPGVPIPHRVVALGGGTGMPAVLRGLKRRLVADDGGSLTAVVAMTDDGGSSGRLRRSRGMPPPGDVRNCLVALAEEEDLLAGLFQHRYARDDELGGHNLGNLILAALAEQTGSFLKAVEASGSVLRTQGRILPVTLDDVALEATLEDGRTLRGERNIGACRETIESVRLCPPEAAATPGVVEAIRRAELIVLGPGSLFTSILPNLLVQEIASALAASSGVVVLVGNLVSEAGEGNGLTLEDHVDVVHRHLGASAIDAVVLHEGPIDESVLERYRAEGAARLEWGSAREPGPRVVRRFLLDSGPKLRHDPEATASALFEAWARVRTDEGIPHAR